MDRPKTTTYDAPEIVHLGEAIRLTEGRNKYVADVAGSGLYYDAKSAAAKTKKKAKKPAAKKKAATKARGRKKK